MIINGWATIPDVTEDGVAVVRHIEDISIVIDQSQVRITEVVGGRDLAEFGLVHVAAYPRPTASLINALADYLDHHNVPAVNLTGIGASTRLSYYVRFALAGLAVPATIYVPQRMLAESFPDLALRLDLPFVLKLISATEGIDTVLVNDENDLARHLAGRGDKAQRVLAQHFVPNDTTYRFLVMGREVALVTCRKWLPNDRATDPTGGETSLVAAEDLDPVAIRLAIDAADLIGSDVANVHLIQQWATGRWHILDAAPNPTIGTGTFAAEKLSAYRAYLHRRLAQVPDHQHGAGGRG